MSSFLKRFFVFCLLFSFVLSPVTASAQTPEQLASIFSILQQLTALLTQQSAQTQLAQVAPTSGLIAHYTFDEGSGTTATDSAGSNTGTLTNGPTWTASGR